MHDFPIGKTKEKRSDVWHLKAFQTFQEGEKAARAQKNDYLLLMFDTQWSHSIYLFSPKSIAFLESSWNPFIHSASFRMQAGNPVWLKSRHYTTIKSTSIASWTWMRPQKIPLSWGTLVLESKQGSTALPSKIFLQVIMTNMLVLTRGNQFSATDKSSLATNCLFRMLFYQKNDKAEKILCFFID